MAGSYRGLLSQGRAVRVGLPIITEDETALTTLVEAWECDASILLNTYPQINTRHPEYSSLVCKNVSPEFISARRGRWTATYRGLRGSGFASGSGGLPRPVWTIESVAGQESIGTLSNLEEIAGTPSEPLNGAIFDPITGIFEAFGPDAPDDLRGVSNYLVPSVVVKKVWYTTGNPDGGKAVGEIDFPGGPLAGSNSSGSQNWLKTGFNAEWYGSFWQISESWLRSGENGWNQDIYG